VEFITSKKGLPIWQHLFGLVKKIQETPLPLTENLLELDNHII
jgi:hypothetical protein